MKVRAFISCRFPVSADAGTLNPSSQAPSEGPSGFKHTLFLALALALAACASSDARRAVTPSPAGSASKTSVAQAAATPLSDLNLVRAKIPEALLAAQEAPYAIPSDPSCTALGAEIEGLDAVLGADLDTPPSSSNPGLVERGTAAAGKAATSAVRSAAEDLVPFRSWVRKLSGAERYSREVDAAIAAGTIRRAFLKGLGQAAGCPVPAAPRR